MNKTILFVDDEEQILKSLKRLFVTTEYITYFAASGEEALDILSHEPIDMIITDMRMCPMNGYQLLVQVKERYPDVIRMILSGYADEKTILKAMNNSLAKLYFYKPWNNEELINTINNIFLSDAMLQSKKLLSFIQKVEDLPTVPALYTKIRSMIEKDAGIAEISDAIEEDPAIGSKLLRIVNSAFYRVNTGSLKQAVLYLGLNNVKNIILSSAVLKIKRGYSYYTSSYIWEHSSSVNKIVGVIFDQLLGEKIKENDATAGLFHDLGKIALYNSFPKEYSAIIEAKEANIELDLYKLEQKVFGVTHAEVGGYLLNWWRLPHSIVESALYCQNPLDDAVINKKLLCAVHIANYFSWSKYREDAIERIEPQTYNYLGITPEDCIRVYKNIIE